MSNKKLVVNKGYTLHTIADDYITKTWVTEDKDVAVAICKMFKDIFGINKDSIAQLSPGQEEDAWQIIQNYLENNKVFVDQEEVDMEVLQEMVVEINEELLGVSETKLSKICLSATVTYSPEDIYVDIIN